MEEIAVDMARFNVGYKPLKGDWVNIEIWRNNNSASTIEDNRISENDVISISPLREKKVHGTVSDLSRGYGVINENIYCPFHVCERGYKLKKGDEVTAIVMESKQARGEWRALSVGYRHKSDKNAKNEETVHKPIPKIKNHDIVVSENLDFGTILLHETHNLEITVTNNGKQRQTFVGIRNIEIVGLTINLGPNLKDIRRNLTDSKQKGLKSVEDVFTKGKLLCPSMFLTTGQSKLVPIKFTPEYLGKISINIEFCFDGFDISRIITACVVDRLQDVIMKDSQPFQKPNRTFFGQKLATSFADRSVVPGQRPVRQRKVFLPNKLARYPIPSNLKDCILNANGDIELLIPEIAQPLHASNYKKKLSSLVYIEEIQQEIEMREFDMSCVLLRKHGEYLSLDVPGLAEGRPSLLLGDRVIVSYHDKGTDSPTYEGYVHEIHADKILLKFNESFHNEYRNDDLDVEFYFNRTSVRREHQSIDHALQMFDIVFPTTVVSKSPLVNLKGGKIEPFNKLLNERQTMAVSRIVTGCGRPVPYILFGPPGTGKTVTVVESILQIFTHIKHSRILVCAPSNSAADLITERLHNSQLLKKSNMIRINAFQRSKVGMPEVIEQYCSKEADDMKLISRHRIVIMTCNMSGFLYSLDLKIGHFTHVFVDEAGQATEPQCLIPVGFVAGCEEAQIVLAGDPFQLGPVLRSDIGQEYGLSMSFLERLTLSKLYQRNEELYGDCGCYDPLVVTKLINNYRSHPKLLKLSSSMFYNRELVPCAAPNMVNICINSNFLPSPDVPFIFHGLRSEDQREGNSPSWFNAMEAVQVLKYVQLILKTYAGKVDVDDIGIITPYRKQVEKIRVLLERFKLSDIKVGSVEEFQGQERLFIIISTVRSNETFVDFDTFHNIGFLSNPKRFNVAITRAQALLVIVGNPVVLCHDPYWCAMLQYAVMTGSYTGSDLPPLNSEVIQDNFKKAMLLLGVTQNDEDSET